MSTAIQKPPTQQPGPPAPPMVQLRNRLLSTLANSGKKLEGIIDRQAVLLACQSIERNPALLKCSPESIFSAIVAAGAYGWTCDGVTGQGAIVPFKGVATLIPGYKGLRDLVRRSGECDLTMEAIHEGDEFEYRGRFSEPHHVTSKDPQRRFKPITGAYVVATFYRTHHLKCFHWTAAECIAHRDRYSQNWRNHPTEDNPWHEKNPSFRIMAMKTVLLDVIHRGEVPVSLKDRSLIQAAVATENTPEPGDMVDAAVVVDPAVPLALEQPMEGERPAEPPVDEDAAREIARQEREWGELLDGLRYEEEIKGWQGNVNLSGLPAEAKARLLKMGNERLAAYKAQRGQRTKKG